MADEVKENDTPKNETEDATPEGGEPEKAEEESKDLQSALAQKEHFREKYERVQKELEEYKKTHPPKSETETEPNKEKIEEWSMSDDPLEIVKLGKALQDNTEEETEFILKNAPTRDIDGILKAKEDPYVKAAIQAMREKVENEKAVPSPSNVSSGGFKLKTKEEIEQMTPEERRKYAEEYIAHRKGTGA